MRTMPLRTLQIHRKRAQEQETNETPAPASVEEAHTLERLRNLIDTEEEIDQIVDNPLEGVPSVVNKSQTKHSKQSRHQKKQQKMAQRQQKKKGPRDLIFTCSACRTSCTGLINRKLHTSKISNWNLNCRLTINLLAILQKQ